jgi:hypothetical protein
VSSARSRIDRKRSRDTYFRENIVFVHEVTGGREKTWTHKDGTFWPQDLPPTDFTEARILTEQRVQHLASLSRQLYVECDETIQLKPLYPDLGGLNLLFRKAEEYVCQGVLNRSLQDMLLNMVDGCYVILKELEQQTKQYQKLGEPEQRGWNDVVWSEDQIQWRVGMLGIYNKGLSAMNTKFSR